MSFFIASDVLLDNWQINNVEHLFLNAERPLRTGGRYYFMIFEKRASQLSEPFGIYGNTGSQWGSIEIGLYGNDRFSPGRTLLSIPDEEFADFFGLDRRSDLKESKSQLARRIVDASRNTGVLTGPEFQAFSKLGLVKDQKLSVLILDDADYRALDGVAALLTDGLVALLNRNRGRLLETYSASPYASETSFNEYFMCWYHFFYTAVTNELRGRRTIDIPANGTTTYLVLR